ncbi:MAG: hypothetical protein ACREAZ_02855 [Nitrososphaera sp.]
MTTPQPNLKEIMKEIRVLRGKIDKLENIVEKRLVGEVKPDKYEKKAAADFERRRRTSKLDWFAAGARATTH